MPGVLFIALASQERSAIDDPRSLILTAAVKTMTTQRVTAGLAVVNTPTSELGERHYFPPRFTIAKPMTMRAIPRITNNEAPALTAARPITKPIMDTATPISSVILRCRIMYSMAREIASFHGVSIAFFAVAE